MERAVAFVERATASYQAATGTEPPKPFISDDCDGGVDIVWRTEERYLFANVPDEPDDVVTLYGRSVYDGGPRISTEVPITSGYGAWALLWVTKHPLASA